MKLGFTGTRKGMTPVQKRELATFIESNDPRELHHGDCDGADEQAHYIFDWSGNGKVVIHPARNDRFRAYCYIDEDQDDEIRPQYNYLTRNHHIVDECDLLFACPDGPERQMSGTWATVRYAHKVGKPVTIVYPNGSVE